MTIQSKVEGYLYEKRGLMQEINERIWEYAEIGLEETNSVSLYENLLIQEGFDMNKDIAGMPTAFVATYGSGKPVIGITAEYDALPGLSQEAGKAEPSPVKAGAHGHGCGHNSLGAGAFGAALAVKEYIKEHQGIGTIKLFGCPSEEKDNGKTFLAREGYFDDLDAAFTWHPMDKNSIWGLRSLANVSIIFNFEGKTAHAAAAPHLGRSALDSVEMMSVGVNYLREHIIPEARVHYAYLNAGGTAPNVVQGTASVHYLIRAPKVEQALEIFERVKDIAKGAALMAGTEVSHEVLTGLSDFIPNPTLSGVLHQAMESYGAPQFVANDFALAKKFFESLSKQEQQNVKQELLEVYGKEKTEQMLTQSLHTEIMPFQISKEAMPGSTDVGDLSHVTPTAQFTMATTALGTSPHTWQMTAQGNTAIALKGVEAAAGAMAVAAIQVIENPEIAEKARRELNEETGGNYICPIPNDVQPNVK